MKKRKILFFLFINIIALMSSIIYVKSETIEGSFGFNMAVSKEDTDRIGYTYTDLLGDDVDGVSIIRKQETNLGNLIGDALVDAAKKKIVNTGYEQLPIIGIQNSGGIRHSIPKGDITKENIKNMLPYDNRMVISQITPKKLYQILEHSVSAIGISEKGDIFGADGRFLQISGFQFIYDPSAKPSNFFNNPSIDGERVLAVYLDGTCEILDRDNDVVKILLVSNDFLLRGEDGYSILSDSEVIYLGNTLDNVVGDFICKISNNGSVGITYRTEGRIQIGQSLGIKKTHISLIVMDELLKSEKEPIIDNYKVMIPMRVLFEYLGWNVVWNEENKTIEAVYESNKVIMQIDNNEILFNYNKIQADVPVKLMDDKAMISMDTVEKILHVKTRWDSQYSTVSIYK